jgi:hypothetical protein
MDSGHGKLNSWKGEFIMTNTKKKNKNKAKLLSAIGMLTVSAAMLVSSTFAWFSINKTVTAKTMQVNVKSNSVYLLIGNESEDTLAKIRGKADGTIATAEPATEATVFPSAWATDAAAGWTSKMTNGSSFATEANWYESEAATVSSATSKGVEATKALTADNFSQHVLKFTYHLTLAEGSYDAKDLKVSKYTPTIKDSTTGRVMTAVKTVVVCGNNYEEFGYTGTGSSKTLKDTGTTVLSNSVTANAITDVIVYVYYDGNEDTVYTNNRANLTGASIDIEFSVVPENEAGA